MKQYLIDTFKYNDWANRKLLISIKQLPDTNESIKLFSHLITSQNKWMNRIVNKIADTELSWFGPLFSVEELENKWTESINNWIAYLEKVETLELEKDIIFKRATDGKNLSVKVREIALQLNYHSIHHRAQINRIIRQQGLTPPSTDYIHTVLKEA